MPKTLQAYGGYSASDIKTRADIPSQTDMTVSGSNVDCVNIKVSDVKNILGESVTGVGALCVSSLVNIWSGFSPVEWYVDATIFKNRVKTPYTLGCWAGYNHGAIAAGYMGSTHMTTFKYISNDTNPYTISVGLQVGEINFPVMVSSTHVKMVVKISGTVVGSQLISIGTSYNLTTPINPYCYVYVGSRTGNINFETAVYLSNANGDELTLFPNVPIWTIVGVQRMPPAAAVHSDPADTTVIKIVGGSATLDLAGNYTISISNVTKWDMTPYTGNITVIANLHDDTGALIYTETVVTNSSLRSFTGYISHTADYDYVCEFVVKVP